MVTILFSNNHDPKFENENNGVGYVFELPMPFPRGVSITSAYNPIFAFDVDITNTRIEFTLEDPSGLFEVMWEKEDLSQLKTRHYANLRAASRLELTEGLDLTIIATVRNKIIIISVFRTLNSMYPCDFTHDFHYNCFS